MKRKSVILPAAAVLVLLAIYGVWHYSPLRYLTRSESVSDQARAEAPANLARPVIIKKRILPGTEKIETTTDIPKPLIVLKDQPVNKTAPPVDLSKEPVTPADKMPETPSRQPEDSFAAQQTRPVATGPGASGKTRMRRPQAPSSKAEPNRPYSIMLSSCRLPQSARKIVSDYQKVGLAPYIVKVKFENGDEWLRVLTGHYQTRQQALDAKNSHELTEAIIKKTPFTNLIGTFPTREAMNETIARIRDLGYSPYFLKTSGGRYKLLVGAFVTEEGAEKQRNELRSKGVQNQVVTR